MISILGRCGLVNASRLKNLRFATWIFAWCAMATIVAAKADVQQQIAAGVNRPTASSAKPASAESTATAVHEAAKRLLAADRIADARSMLTGHAEQQNDSIDVEVKIASLLFEIGKPKDGLRVLEAHAVQGHNPFEIHLAYARIAANETRWADADAHLHMVLASSPPSQWSEDFERQQKAAVVRLIAEVASARGDWKRAAESWTRFLKVRSDDREARLQYAAAIFRLGQHQDAYRELQTIRGASPQPEAFLPELRMARWFESATDLERAEKWYRQALSENAAVEVRCELARFLVDRNRPAEAMGCSKDSPASVDQPANVSSSSFPTQPDCFVLVVGLASRMLGRWDDAEAALREMRSRQPGNALVTSHLSLVLIEQKDPNKRQEALRLASQTVATAANSTSLTALGWVKAKLGDLATAEALLTQAMATGVEVPRDAAWYLADVKRKLGKDNEADTLEDFSRRAVGPEFHRR